MTLSIACGLHSFTMYCALIVFAVSHGCLNSLVTTIVFKPYRQGLLKAAKRLLPARLRNGVELLASSTAAKSGVYSSDRPVGKSLEEYRRSPRKHTVTYSDEAIFQFISTSSVSHTDAKGLGSTILPRGRPTIVRNITHRAVIPSTSYGQRTIGNSRTTLSVIS